MMKLSVFTEEAGEALFVITEQDIKDIFLRYSWKINFSIFLVSSRRQLKRVRKKMKCLS